MTKATWIDDSGSGRDAGLRRCGAGRFDPGTGRFRGRFGFLIQGRQGACEGARKGHHKSIGAAHYAWQSRGANSPYFCPPGQAKKPGLGSAHRC